jgi:hypothetical protein
MGISHKCNHQSLNFNAQSVCHFCSNNATNVRFVILNTTSTHLLKVAGATFRAVAEDRAFDAVEDEDCCWRKKHLPARAWHLTPNFIAMNRLECSKSISASFQLRWQTALVGRRATSLNNLQFLKYDFRH